MVNAPATPRLHPGSLVDSTSHSPAILELVQRRIDRSVIEYLVDLVSETVDYAMNSPSSSDGARRGRSATRDESFADFVEKVLTCSETTMPTLLVTLVYIVRAKPHLRIALEDWALERVFLGALVTASKYANDSSLKNVHWAMCTGVFGRRDILRIEREYLEVLDWELGMTEDDVLVHHDGLTPKLPAKSRLPKLHPSLYVYTPPATTPVELSPEPAAMEFSLPVPDDDYVSIDAEMVVDPDTDSDAEWSDGYSSSGSSPASSPMPSTPAHESSHHHHNHPHHHTHHHHHHHSHHHHHNPASQKEHAFALGKALLSAIPTIPGSSHDSDASPPSHAAPAAVPIPAGATFPYHPSAIRPVSSSVWI